MVITIVFLVAMLLIYNYLVFDWVDAFLKKPRLKRIFRIPMGIVNTLLVLAFMRTSGSTALSAYIGIGVFLFVELVLFYKDKRACILFCVLTCVMHVMAVRALCVAGAALVMHSSIYDIVQTPQLLALSTGISCMALNVIAFVSMKLVPAKSVRMINAHSEQLWFILAWMSVFCMYLLINAKEYSIPNDRATLLVNQIVAPIAILMGTYIIFWVSMKTGELLGYKEKSVELQHSMERERQYRTILDKDVFRVVELNFNKGEIISGFEEYEQQLGDAVYDYGKMLAFIIQEMVHVEDRGEFIKYLSPRIIIKEFEAGKTEMSLDYRRLMPDGHYVWMHAFMALVQDTQSGDIKGFVQVRDIDGKKKKQLDLQYKAERDLLTGLYNKGTTEMLISKQLEAHNGKGTPGVLFIIDVDNFKVINDRLGHLVGDTVLSDLSESLLKIFRDCDIVGRIGGDEFLVFVEGLENESAMVKKASSICNAFLQTYANGKDEGYTVSSSIGIAVFPRDGDTFEALFKCADAALYKAKAQGKNTCAFYDRTVAMPQPSAKMELDTHGLARKSCKKNRAAYTFRLLYSAEDTTSDIESALELIAKQFGFSRANIFECNEPSTHFDGVFEWCAAGIDSVSANYKDMPVSNFDFVISDLEKHGGICMAVPADFPEHVRESYTAVGIQSIVYVSIMARDKLIGVIAFQYCGDDNVGLSNTALEKLHTSCQVLSLFMANRLPKVRERSVLKQRVPVACIKSRTRQVTQRHTKPWQQRIHRKALAKRLVRTGSKRRKPIMVITARTDDKVRNGRPSGYFLMMRIPSVSDKPKLSRTAAGVCEATATIAPPPAAITRCE